MGVCSSLEFFDAFDIEQLEAGGDYHEGYPEGLWVQLGDLPELLF